MKTSRVAGLFAVVTVTVLATVARAEDPWTYVQGKYVTIAKVVDANQFLAYSTKVGDWKKHTFKKSVKAVPVVGDSIGAFMLSGDEIAELVAVDQRGNWRTTKLLTPTVADCKPAVDDVVAVYTVDGQTYAFSAITGTWDSIPTKAAPFLGQDTAMVVTGDSIAIFSAETGKWAEASLKSDGK